MDPTTLTLILGFLATQTGVVIAFLKWKEDNRREINKFLTMTTGELAELKRILSALLVELGYPQLVNITAQLPAEPAEPKKRRGKE